jgi:hypothetical protein
LGRGFARNESDPPSGRPSRAIAAAFFFLAACSGSSEPASTEPPPSTSPSPDRPSPQLSPLRGEGDCRAATEVERAAIATAEAFVRDAGYTDAPPAPGATIPQDILDPGDPGARAAMHHATLVPHALGVFPNDGSGPITVVFGYERAYLARIFAEPELTQRLGETGRAVVVSADAAPRIVHQDAMLSHVQSICADP